MLHRTSLRLSSRLSIPQVNTWIFGHTHVHTNVTIDGCRLLSNPRGYPNEHTGYDPSASIQL